MYLLFNSFVNSLGYPSFMWQWTIAYEDAKIMAGHRKSCQFRWGVLSSLICFDVQIDYQLFLHFAPVDQPFLLFPTRVECNWFECIFFQTSFHFTCDWLVAPADWQASLQLWVRFWSYFLFSLWLPSNLIGLTLGAHCKKNPDYSPFCSKLLDGTAHSEVLSLLC